MNREKKIKLLVFLILLLLVSCSDMAGSGSSTGNAFVAGVIYPDTTFDDSTYVVHLVPENYLPYDEELGKLIQVDTIQRGEEFLFAVDSTITYNVHVESENTSALLRGQNTRLVRSKTIKSDYYMRPHGFVKIITDKDFDKSNESITIEGMAIAREIKSIAQESDSTKSFVISKLPSKEYSGLYITEDRESQIFVDESFHINPYDTAVVANISAKGVMTPFNSGLPSHSVYSIAIDQMDRIHFATKTGIIGIYNGSHWRYIDINYFGFFSAVLDVVFEEDSSMWCGTNVGLLHFDGAEIYHYSSYNSPLPNDRIHGMAIDEAGDRWFATMGGGVARLSKDMDWTIYNPENSELPSNYILRVRKDRKDSIWAICNHGVAKFNGEDWDVYNRSVNDVFSCDTISASAFDDENAWFASVDGSIVRRGPDGWDRFDYTNSPLKRSPIYAMYVDSRGKLWAANSHGEIYAYKNEEWIIYNCYNSCVPANTGRMISIVEDKEGTLWVSTEYAGVIEFVPKGALDK